MKETSITRQGQLEKFSRASMCAGRTLIVLTAILLVAMPWTEYFWQFDKFLRGGQDLEFGLLSLAAIFCLILVLSHQRKRTVAFFFAVRRRFAFVVRANPLMPRSLCGLISSLHAVPLPSPSLDLYNLPIQV